MHIYMIQMDPRTLAECDFHDEISGKLATHEYKSEACESKAYSGGSFICMLLSSGGITAALNSAIRAGLSASNAIGCVASALCCYISSNTALTYTARTIWPESNSRLVCSTDEPIPAAAIIGAFPTKLLHAAKHSFAADAYASTLASTLQNKSISFIPCLRNRNSLYFQKIPTKILAESSVLPSVDKSMKFRVNQNGVSIRNGEVLFVISAEEPETVFQHGFAKADLYTTFNHARDALDQNGKKAKTNIVRRRVGHR